MKRYANAYAVGASALLDDDNSNYVVWRIHINLVAMNADGARNRHDAPYATVAGRMQDSDSASERMTAKDESRGIDAETRSCHGKS